MSLNPIALAVALLVVGAAAKMGFTPASMSEPELEDPEEPPTSSAKRSTPDMPERRRRERAAPREEAP